MRQRVLHRVELALRVIPRHRRRAALSLASSLRTALDGRLTLGLERALHDLPDDADAARWLDRAAALISATAIDSTREEAERPARARAIILLGPSRVDPSEARPRSVG